MKPPAWLILALCVTCLPGVIILIIKGHGVGAAFGGFTIGLGIGRVVEHYQ